MTRSTVVVLLSAALALASTPDPGRAQQVAGRLTLADGRNAAGTLVIATPAGNDTVAHRALVGENGHYQLSLAAGRWRLRALRVGFRPVDLGEVALADGERRDLSLILPTSPVQLSAVSTRADRTCRGVRGAGPQVATLIEEARTALASSLLAPPEGRPEVEAEVTEVLADPGGRVHTLMSSRRVKGASARPFQGLPPGLVAVTGYVTQEVDQTVFRAPDARILLSSEFSSSHCFAIAEERDRPEWIGVRFAPMRRRSGIVDIEGTMWLDRGTFELRRVDYRYAGLTPPLDRWDLGGFVEFEHLADGAWFESRWEVRMPRTTIAVATDQASAMRGERGELRLDALQLARGEVMSLRRGDRLTYSVNSAFADVVALRESIAGGGDIGQPAAVVADTVLARSACASVTGEDAGSVAGLVRDGDTHSGLRAQVTAEWKENFRRGAQHDWAWTTRQVSTRTALDGFYTVCGVPESRLIMMQATAEPLASRKVAVRIANGARRVRADLWIDAPPSAAPRRSVAVIVLDPSGGAIPHALVRPEGQADQVADAGGRVTIPAPPDRSVRLAVRRIGFKPFDGEAVQAAGSGEIVVTLTPVATLDAVRVTARAPGALAARGFYDRLERARRGAVSGDFFTPEQLAERNAARVSQVLATARGLRVTRAVEPAQRTIIVGRGDCSMTVLIDGVRVNVGLTDLEQAVPIDELVDARSVVAIEVYPSTANAPADLIPLTGGGSCGLIAIWTGSP